MSSLFRLLRQLGADANLSREFHQDPAAVIARYDLTVEEREALLSKDYAAIKRLTGLKDGQFATNSTISAYDN